MRVNIEMSHDDIDIQIELEHVQEIASPHPISKMGLTFGRSFLCFVHDF